LDFIDAFGFDAIPQIVQKLKYL